MSRRILHSMLALLALAPGSLGVYLVLHGPTVDTPRSTLIVMALPLLSVSAALLLFTVWSAVRERRNRRRL
jgi:hypothetical protein